MQKKIIAVVLTLVLVCCIPAVFSGCGSENSDYPVTVGNVTFENEPENIVVLSDDLADIISYMGYDVKMVGKGSAVTQEDLKVVPEVGSDSTPDTAKIAEAQADVVFSDADLDPDVQTALEEQGVKVVKMVSAQTNQELSTVYKSLGTILGGKNTGAQKGEKAYNDLISAMNDVKSQYSANTILNTVCYLYAEDGRLKTMCSGTFGDLLLGYTGAVNVAVDASTDAVDEKQMRISNPTYIFYSDKTALDMIKSNDILKNLNAVKGGKMLEIPLSGMTRPGKSALQTLKTITEYMYPPEGATQAAVQTAGLAEQYKITIPEKGLAKEDENDSVKAMQSRLKDLGYISDPENVTGYYGETSEKAVSAFQKNSGIEETGKADKATLEKMFSQDAAKANSPVDA